MNGFLVNFLGYSGSLSLIACLQCVILIFPLSLGSRLFLIVLICLIFCYILLIRVDVSVPSGAFLSLAGILLFDLCCWCCQCQC